MFHSCTQALTGQHQWYIIDFFLKIDYGIQMLSLSLSLCPVNVDEKLLNLEKTTSSVLSVLLLIYGAHCFYSWRT